MRAAQVPIYNSQDIDCEKHHSVAYLLMAADRVRERVTALVSTCHRHVSRAAVRLKTAAGGRHLSRRFASTALLSRRVSDEIGLIGERMKRLKGRCGWGRRRCSRSATTEIWDDEKEEEGVWKRTILMGEKCQPLEFSGVIYYDCKGTRVVAPHRSPLRNPPVVAEGREKGKT
ncbi:hypothetical protein HPP92_026410 [Vanilla planifolia]|uniref:Uncharacterized protein n=1 Tax=Vanilla planifolia TaxID=51239 RepID=A0A835PFJ4_VANPL|nr:hypothetical protein HPP92_026410 [Vanilla planifolia]